MKIYVRQRTNITLYIKKSYIVGIQQTNQQHLDATTVVI